MPEDKNQETTQDKLNKLDAEIEKVKTLKGRDSRGLGSDNSGKFNNMIEVMEKELMQLEKVRTNHKEIAVNNPSLNINDSMNGIPYANDEKLLEAKAEIFSKHANKMLSFAEKIEKQADKGTVSKVKDVLKSGLKVAATLGLSKSAKRELKTNYVMAKGGQEAKAIQITAKAIATEMKTISAKKEGNQPDKSQSRQVKGSGRGMGG